MRATVVGSHSIYRDKQNRGPAVYSLEHLPDSSIESDVYVAQRISQTPSATLSMGNIVLILEMPEIMACGMALSEHHEKQVPWLFLQQPFHDLGFLRDGRQQSLVE